MCVWGGGGGWGALAFTIFNQLMAIYETDVITIPILQMGKLRHREVEKLAQSHTVSGTGWDLDLAVWLQSPGHSKAT